MIDNVKQMRKLLNQLNESMMVNFKEVYEIPGDYPDDYWNDMADEMSILINNNVLFSYAEYDEKSRIIVFNINTYDGVIVFKLMQSYYNDDNKDMPVTKVDIDFEFLEDEDDSEYLFNLGRFPIDDAKVFTRELISDVVSWADHNNAYSISDYFS